MKKISIQKKIKNDLETQYPGCVFNVQKSRWAIYIYWNDGPSSFEIEKSIDCDVICQRKFSNEIISSIIESELNDLPMVQAREIAISRFTRRSYSVGL